MSEIIAHDDESLLDELLQCCQSDSISLEGLREIVQRHGITSANSSRHINDYDFFYHACCNDNPGEATIQYLMNVFPAAVYAIDEEGRAPLHFACTNIYVTPSVIRLLVEAHPSACQLADEDGTLPLHSFCCALSNNDSGAIEILKILLKDRSSTAKHANNDGMLPIHYAARARSPEFCSVLIDAYPGSERISDEVIINSIPESERMAGNEDGSLPFHIAIRFNDIATVEYFYKLYPEAIYCNSTNTCGPTPPIYLAITRLVYVGEKYCVNRDVADIVRFLLKCDPNIKFQNKFGSEDFHSLLRCACICATASDLSNIDEGIKVVKAVYDAHPELINDDEFNFDRFHPLIQSFLNDEFVYARQAMNHRWMTTPDEKGQLPLHHALERNVRLGSIKLLVEGNPPAIREGDHNSAVPLHVACEHHYSPEVIEYLVGLDPSLLQYEDADGNTALHYACRGAKYTTISLLLDKFDAVSVSRKNRHSKLPIDLLLESDAVEDRESVEYTNIVFRLLRAHPDTMLDKAIELGQSVSASSSSTDQVGKKRKGGLLNE